MPVAFIGERMNDTEQFDADRHDCQDHHHKMDEPDDAMQRYGQPSKNPTIHELYT